MGIKCDYHIGCHACQNALQLLHAAIRQELREPEINTERIRKELVSIKNFIEDLFNLEVSDGN